MFCIKFSQPFPEYSNFSSYLLSKLYSDTSLYSSLFIPQVSACIKCVFSVVQAPQPRVPLRVPVSPLPPRPLPPPPPPHAPRTPTQQAAGQRRTGRTVSTFLSSRGKICRPKT